MGKKWWNSRLGNSTDSAGKAIISTNLSLASELAFDWVYPDPVTMGPQTYEWYFDDIPEGGHYGEHASVGFSEPLVNFTPGFDASRSADKTVFTASGNQILTITVMPKEAMAWFGIHVFVSEDDKVVPTITSPTMMRHSIIISLMTEAIWR